MRGALKRLEGRDYDTEIEEAEQEHNECEENLYDQKAICEDLRGEIGTLTKNITEIDTKIESIPAEVINIAQVRVDIKDKAATLAKTQEQLTQEKTIYKKRKILSLR